MKAKVVALLCCTDHRVEHLGKAWQQLFVLVGVWRSRHRITCSDGVYQRKAASV